MQGQIIRERYKIDTVIGRGGMACVYTAFDEILKRRVAIKVLHKHFTHNAHFIERFKREAFAAASLIHPNITTIYDTGYADGAYYIVMEHVEGNTLKQIMDERAPLPVNEAVHIARQVAEALVHAHSRQIIHRDIKPQNILIGEDHIVKVTDFGIARALMMPGLTQTGKVLGTARYISPEQARGQQADHRSDIYCLGVILYEMVTGRPIFEGANSVDIAGKHISEMPKRVRDLNPRVPVNLEVIINRLLRKDPDERYQSIERLLRDLSQWDSLEKEDLIALTIPPRSRGDRKKPAARPAERKRRVIEVRDFAEPIEAEPDKNSRPSRPHPKQPARRRKKLTPFAKMLMSVAALVILGYMVNYINYSGGDGKPVVKRMANTTAEKTRFQGQRVGQLIPVEVVDYDPDGDGDENPSQLERITDGSKTSAWATESYRTSTFAGEKDGVGVYMDYGKPVGMQKLTLQSSEGWSGAVKGSDDLLNWETLQDVRSAGENVTLKITGKPYRYYLVWINKLPRTGGGYRCKIYKIVAHGKM